MPVNIGAGGWKAAYEKARPNIYKYKKEVNIRFVARINLVVAQARTTKEKLPHNRWPAVFSLETSFPPAFSRPVTRL